MSKVGTRNANDKYISIASDEYDFANVLNKLFSLDSLEKLHYDCDDLSPFLNADLGRDSHSKYHRIFYQSIKVKESPIRILWEKFCKTIVKQHFPEEEPLIIQALPNLRIQVPGAQAVHRWHCDSDDDHRHPLGEINAILAITDMSDTNSVWRESLPNKGDFQPFALSANELVYWNGNTCIHGNKKNTTDQTRVSLNFRVIPTYAYNKYVVNGSLGQSVTTSTKFRIGDYYHCI